MPQQYDECFKTMSNVLKIIIANANIKKKPKTFFNFRSLVGTATIANINNDSIPAVLPVVSR